MTKGPGAVIFDRDGVLNRDCGYAYRPDQIEWTEDAAEAVRAVNEAGLYALVATNQSGVARGYYHEADVEALHEWMNAQMQRLGACIDGFAFCPHHREGTVEAYRRACPSRKPAPGMILRLVARFALDPRRTVMIGDQPTDLEAAAAAGIAGVRFGGGSLLQVVRPLVQRLGAMTRA